MSRQIVSLRFHPPLLALPAQRIQSSSLTVKTDFAGQILAVRIRSVTLSTALRLEQNSFVDKC
jgi:hypothetical protein